MASRQFPHLADRVLIELCNLFLAGEKAGAVAKVINTELDKQGSQSRVTRQQIYALLNDARRRGFFEVRAPRHTILGQAIADLYQVDKDSIIVVNAQGERAYDHVAQEAARVAVRLIVSLGEERRGRGPVHVGLGAGFTTLNIARHLAHELRALRSHPDLVLHALSPGFQVDHPRTSPLGFFGLFDAFGDRVRYVGLFASTGVNAKDYDVEIRKYPVSVAFRCKREIDIIITSLASARDEHGKMNHFLKMQPQAVIRRLERAGWIGDLQYRAFSAEGPITREPSVKTVTLFELAELRRFVTQRDKHLLLVSAPCADCGMTREEPMEALLSVPELKVWTHVIMDVETSERLAEMARRKAGQKSAAEARPAAGRPPARR